MIKLGLIGRNISHSRSQEMYEGLLGTSVEYDLLDYASDADIKDLQELFSKGYLGLSVTYPYKKHFLDHVVITDDKIKNLNAVNCIRRNGSQFEATNTDYLAARHLLENEYSQFKEYLVLGSGNMAKIFCSLLNSMNRDYRSFARSRDGDLNKLTYKEIIHVDPKDTLIINCCSRDFTFTADLPSDITFWDMNYSFTEHDPLKDREFYYIEGLNLLQFQAKYALEFWDIALNRNS
jgi:shikimate dehydrogenase